MDARVVRQAILSDAQRHHELFERRVARALADAVHRAFDLPHAALNRGEAVGHRETQVVVAVRAEHGATGIGHAGDDLGEEVPDLVRRGVADGVGEIHRGAAGLNHRFDDAAEEVAVAARRIFR